MAETFHFNISMISRGKSKSAVASAAYISCEKIKNEWDGVTHDYHNKKGYFIRKYSYWRTYQKNFKTEVFYGTVWS